MISNFERLQHEIMRMNESRLKEIKNEKECDNETATLLWNADVLEEILMMMKMKSLKGKR
jgi:hypothetical protein